MAIGKHFLAVRVTSPWNSLPGEVAGVLLLQSFKAGRGKALETSLWGPIQQD